MSRITGSDALKMFEAYAAVYPSVEQIELTEEQVWEEVETWVNSLLEEGYDLSDYTWEEMYESYLSEDGKWVNIPGKGRRFVTGTGEVRMGDPNAPLAGFARGVKKFFTQPARLTPAQMRASTSGVPMSGPGSGSAPEASKPKPERQGPIVPDRIKNAKPEASGDATPVVATTAAPRPTADVSPTGGKGKVAPTKPAAAAQTGDKAKDMATWAKANPKLAAAAAERARTRGTSATTNPQMDGLKSRLPAPAAPKVAPSNTLSNTVAAASKPAAFSPAPEVKATNTIAAAPKPAPVSPRQARLNMEMEYDAYDVVLEYLLSQGHAETVEEAHYVMLEMDAETIGTIVEAASDQSDKQIDKGVKTTYKAQNVLDNQHQGRSKGLNKLPRGEREEKAKRMSGRLKSRRDDLFGERNKREDSRRDELKKMLGL